MQAGCIPAVLAGRDLLAAAQTGTGKTAGFTLPMLQRLAEGARVAAARRPVRALILTPTRELAAQVEQSVRTYGRHLSLRSTMICGGASMNLQVRALREGVDVLVATPGRLLDHLRSRTVDLGRVEIVVLDEADRMLDMGFIHDMRRILPLLPRTRQSLFFSATFSTEIRRLADSFLTQPEIVEVARQQLASELVTQVVHPVDRERKRDLLAHLVREGNWQQVLVFTRTKHGATRLAQQLSRDGLEADAIHGNRSQSQRTRALEGFKRGRTRVLVATDIAARGLDISLLPHVVNYELPFVPEDYVHRIGRTGRAGSEGDAVSLVASDERNLLHGIERLLRHRIPQRVVEGFEPSANAAPSSPVARNSNHRQSPRERSRGGVEAARSGRSNGSSRVGMGSSATPSVRDAGRGRFERRHRQSR